MFGSVCSLRTQVSPGIVFYLLETCKKPGTVLATSGSGRLQGYIQDRGDRCRAAQSPLYYFQLDISLVLVQPALAVFFDTRK